VYMPQTRRGRKQGTKMNLSSGRYAPLANSSTWYVTKGYVLIDQQSDREKQEIESSERQTSLNSPTNDFTYNFWCVLFIGPLIGVHAPDCPFVTANHPCPERQRATIRLKTGIMKLMRTI
jgi:hypothetical protein